MIKLYSKINCGLGPSAGVVPCGSRKKSPHTLSIVQIILSFYWSFEISGGGLRNEKNYHRFRFLF